VGGCFRSFLKGKQASSRIPPTAVGDWFNPFCSNRCQPAANPTDCRPWDYSAPFYSNLATWCESHGRQSVDYSDPFYSNRWQPVANPTDGSPWTIQILSTATAGNQLRIPRTAVRGLFRSFLEGKASLGISSTGSGWMVHILSARVSNLLYAVLALAVESI